MLAVWVLENWHGLYRFRRGRGRERLSIVAFGSKSEGVVRPVVFACGDYTASLIINDDPNELVLDQYTLVPNFRIP